MYARDSYGGKGAPVLSSDYQYQLSIPGFVVVVWTANSDGTLTPELMAVNPESNCRTSKAAIISHGPSVRTDS